MLQIVQNSKLLLDVPELNLTKLQYLKSRRGASVWFNTSVSATFTYSELRSSKATIHFEIMDNSFPVHFFLKVIDEKKCRIQIQPLLFCS